jgi:hypothetical protein
VSRAARPRGPGLSRFGFGLAGLLALSCGARAADDSPAPAAPAPAAVASTGRDTTSAARPADTTAATPRPRSIIQQLIAEGDSAVRKQGGPRADAAQLYLSWGAPWGSRRARRSRLPACADSTAEDTLYLSFMPGRAAQRFTGFTAQLFLRATGADTLGTWWHMESKGGANAGNLRAEWAAAPDFGWRQPFPVSGQGFALLDRTPGAVRLRMVFAVPADAAGPVAADSTYALCRIIFKHRPERRLAGCGQPVCIEWASATLAFGPKDEPRVGRGERFASYGGPQALCEPFKGPRVEAWKPGARPPSAAAADTSKSSPR